MSANTASSCQEGGRDPHGAPLHCPMMGCRGTMRSVDKMEPDPRTGLGHMTCPSCGHYGYVASQGLHLLFKDGREYVFSYGPSLATLTVVFTCAMRARFATVPADDLAKAVAGRALLLGRTAGVVDLSDRVTRVACSEPLDVPPIPESMQPKPSP